MPRRRAGDVLAEIDFELLDALDHRQDHIARSRPGEVRGAERRDPVIQRLPEPRLHARRRVVGDHVSVVVEHAPQHDGGGGERGRQQQGAQRLARDHAGEQPAEEDEPADAHADRDEADQHGPRDAQAHAASEGPQPRIEVHGQSPCRVTIASGSYPSGADLRGQSGRGLSDASLGGGLDDVHVHAPPIVPGEPGTRRSG